MLHGLLLVATIAAAPVGGGDCPPWNEAGRLVAALTRSIGGESPSGGSDRVDEEDAGNSRLSRRERTLFESLASVPGAFLHVGAVTCSAMLCGASCGVCGNFALWQRSQPTGFETVIGLTVVPAALLALSQVVLVTPFLVTALGLPLSMLVSTSRVRTLWAWALALGATLMFLPVVVMAVAAVFVVPPVLLFFVANSVSSRASTQGGIVTPAPTVSERFAPWIVAMGVGATVWTAGLAHAGVALLAETMVRTRAYPRTLPGEARQEPLAGL